MEKTRADRSVSDAGFHHVLGPSFVDGLRDVFEERITFNRVLGLKLVELGEEQVGCRIDMRPELVGHFAYGRLHGGVISAMLDATGGLAVLSAAGVRYRDESREELLERFSRLGTIDLRVDYLRQGLGAYFVSTGRVLRLGGRVATTRMELHNDENLLVATGTAAYIVS